MMKKQIIQTIKSSLKKRGVTLLKNKQHAELIAQRDALLGQLVNADAPRKGLVGVCFSMDRPIQLYATLESYFHHVKNPAPLHIMYAVSDKKYVPAYKELIKAFKGKEVYFYHEKKFRADLITLLDSLKEDGLFFLVDDDVFVRDYDLKKWEKFNPLKEVVSLRMAPYYTRSYTMNMNQLPPKSLKKSKKHKGMLEWYWGADDAGNEWAYPLSVEMHLFDRKEILAMTKAVAFKAPNTYEGALMHFYSALKGRTGLCYPEQYIFNNPCNKVQTENDNIAGDITPEFLLDKWNEGYKIDTSLYEKIQTTGPHEEQPIHFVKR